MITIDFAKLRNLLTPAPLRNASLLGALLDAALAPIASVYASQGNHEQLTADQIANIGPRRGQIMRAVCSLTGLSSSDVSINEDLWLAPRRLLLDSDQYQRTDGLEITTDQEHAQHTVGVGSTIGATNRIYNDASCVIPLSFTIYLNGTWTRDTAAPVARYVEVFKSPAVKFRLFDGNNTLLYP